MQDIQIGFAGRDPSPTGPVRYRGLVWVWAALLLLGAITVSRAASPPPCYSPSSGLVSWWGAEGSAVDQTGTNNGVLVNGAGFGAGQVGQAFSFNGNQQCVTIPYSPTLAAPTYSVEAWIEPQAQVSNGLNQDGIIGQAYGWQLLVRGGSSGMYVAFQFATSYTSFPQVQSDAQIPIGQFSHLVGTWDGTTLSLYINGVLNATTVPGVTPVDSGYPIYIGGYYIQSDGGVSYSDQYFNGLIDEASYYSRALAADEIQSLYNAGSSGKCGAPTPPSIQTQPQSQTVVSGTNVNLRVVAAGSPPLSYQWHLDGTNLPGATSPVLTPTNVQTADAGTYDVAVTNLFGATNSVPVTLSVLNPPHITLQPADQTVIVGSNVTFSVTATGDAPLSYQWYYNSAALGGASDSSLVLNGVALSQQGSYKVSVSNAVGRVFSRTASLIVQSGGPCAPPSASLVSWWAGEGDASDKMGANNGVLVNGVGFGVGEVGEAFGFNGTPQCVSIPYSPSLAAPTCSVEAWIEPQGQPHNVLRQDLVIGQAYGWQLVVHSGTSGVFLAFYFATSTTDFYQVSSVSQIPLGQFSHVVGTWDGTTLKLYINGVLNASSVPGATPVDLGYPIYIGGFYSQGGALGNYSDQFFKGLIDEASYYNGVLTPTDVQALYNAGSSGKCGTPLPPLIQTQLQSRTVAAGATVNFSVAVAGSGPLSYQWHLDGTNLPGATSPALILVNVQAANAGTYDVAVTNLYGATNSLPATLTVLSPPQITAQPQDQTVGVGSNATFSVTATGDAPLSYQWYYNGAVLSDATGSSLILSAVTQTQGGSYKVSISNAVGAVSSRGALLFVQGGTACAAPPAGLVSWWPAEQNAADNAGTNNGVLVNGVGFSPGEVGQAFSFNGTTQCVTIPYSHALAAPTYSVEAWVEPLAQPNNDLGQDLIIGQAYGWQLVVRHGISGVKVVFDFATSYTSFPEVLSGSEIPLGQFSHVVGTWDGTTLSLYINGALSAAVAPGATPVDLGYPFYIGGFFSQSGSLGNYSDQFFNGLIDEAGYYNRPLAAAEVRALYNAGSFGKCSTPVPPSILAQPQGQTVAVGASVSFSIGAAGTGPLSYQWHFDGADIAGATGPMLSLTNVQSASAGTYDVAVTNVYGATNSLPVTLAVLNPPQITVQPQDQTVSVGSEATFSVTVTGDAPLAYQWYYNGALLSDATNSSLVLSAATQSLGGSYQVSVSNPVGAVSSRGALLFVQGDGSCATPPAGLVSWWAAEGDATDKIGTNNGVLVNGAGFAAGEVGQAFSFNGTTQCVTIPYSTTLVASNYSVEAWIEPQGPVTNLLGQNLIIGQAYGWQLVVRPGTSGLYAAFLFGTSHTSFPQVLGTSQIPIGQFSYLAGTWDGATLSLYINGALNATATPGVSPTDSGLNLYIGGYYIQSGTAVSYSDQYFNGLIDEAAYYGRALAADEVQALYNAGPAGKCGTSAPAAIPTQTLGRMAVTDTSASRPTCQIENLGNGSFRLLGNGTAGTVYRFQRTTNLFNGGWTDLGSATADGLGACQFIDHPPANAPSRYRIVSP